MSCRASTPSPTEVWSPSVLAAAQACYWGGWLGIMGVCVCVCVCSRAASFSDPPFLAQPSAAGL